MEFRSVLYLPGMAPLNNEDITNPKTKNIRLYVKRVFISDDFDGELVSFDNWLITIFLKFVNGIMVRNKRSCQLENKYYYLLNEEFHYFTS